MPSLLEFPTRIHLGPGAVGSLATELSDRGLTRALVVTDGPTRELGALDRVKAVLELTEASCSVYEMGEGSATEAAVHDGVSALREAGADHLIAVGGGAVLDVAKGVRLLATHAPPLSQYATRSKGARFVSADLPPLVAVPTAGDGSEVTASFVVAFAETPGKGRVASPHLMPTVALCDPDLTLRLPARDTAASGFATLTHNVEAYLATGLHPLADAIAIRGIVHTVRHLGRAVENGNDAEARLGLVVASIMGGTAAQKGLGATHALAHALEWVGGLPHGLGAALVLPAVLRFVGEAAPERVEDVATAVGASGAGYGDAPGTRAAARMEELRARVGLPATLTEAGIDPERIPDVVERALADEAHLESPRPVTAGELRRVLESVAG